MFFQERENIISDPTRWQNDFTTDVKEQLPLRDDSYFFELDREETQDPQSSETNGNEDGKAKKNKKSKKKRKAKGSLNVAEKFAFVSKGYKGGVKPFYQLQVFSTKYSIIRNYDKIC